MKAKPRFQSAIMWLSVVALIVIHYVLAVASVAHKSPTNDEVAHITAGVAYWRLNDYRLNPENGNLPQRLAGLPLAAADDIAFPDADAPGWVTSDVWQIGDQFFFDIGNDLETLVRRSRAAIAVTGAVLCLVVFLWSRQLWGRRGGFVSLVLCAFSPTILAHARLATSDIVMALMMTIATAAVWAVLRRITVLRVILCGLAVGGALVAKSSSLLLLPITAAAVAITIVRGPHGKRWHRLGRIALAGLGCAMVAWVVVWSCFGWRYGAVADGAPPFDEFYRAEFEAGTVDAAAAATGVPGRILGACAKLRLLPEAFLYGTSFVVANLTRPAFLNGHWGEGGWWYFFPVAFLYKSTLPLLLLTAALPVAAVVAWRRGRRRAFLRRVYRPAILGLVIVIVMAALMRGTMNIGHRHMLPVYPALFILAGALTRLRAKRIGTVALAVLLGWHVVEGLRAYPHYLAYFNPTVGRRNAYRHLVDSSLDWGQDLPHLKRALAARREAGTLPKRVYLGYFGTARPAYYNLDVEPLKLEARHAEGLRPRPGGGLYCVSATLLQAVYYPVQGDWEPRDEAQYQTLATAVRRIERSSAQEVHAMRARDPQGFSDFLTRYCVFGTARILAHLRAREPDGYVGYSILLYELTDEEARRLLEDPVPVP